MMARLVALLVFASLPVAAEVPATKPPLVRIGAILGFQQTDRSAWDFGPSVEVTLLDELSFRGEALLELGNFDDPFGDSNIIPGNGPHVNHVMFGPVWRPARLREYQVAAGIEGGILIMHSLFAAEHFTKKPAAGMFVQAGRVVGGVTLALELRFDLSETIPMGGPNGSDVPTTSGRLNFIAEFPIGH